MDVDAYPSLRMVTTVATVDILMMRSIRGSSGLGTAEFRLLGVLTRQPEGMRSNALASVLGLTPAVVSSTLSKLASAGLVTKASVDGDARGLLACHTPAGKEAFEAANQALADLVLGLWRGMPEDLRRLSFRGTARVDEMEKGDLSGRRAGTKFVTLFFETYHISHSHIETTLGAFDLSVSDYRLLRLAVESGGCSMSEASRELFLAPNRISASTSGLVQRGLLQKMRDVSDSRTYIVAATEAGTAQLSPATEALAYSMRHIPYAVSEQEGADFERQAVHLAKRLATMLD